MRLLHEHVPDQESSSFRSFTVMRERLVVAWHNHPEYELTLLEHGCGQRLVGDSMRPFAGFDLVLIGPDLPHTWRADAVDGPFRGACIQFRHQWISRLLACVREPHPVSNLLEAARRGLWFERQAVDDILPDLRRVPEVAGVGRVGLLLQVLANLATVPRERRGTIVSPAYAPPQPQASSARQLADICQWLNDHCDQPCRQADVARRFGLSAATLGRAFRRHLDRGYSHYLQEVRIARACDLLTDGRLPIADVGVAVGMPGQAHFNRVFKRERGCTPRQWRRQLADAAGNPS